MQYLRRDQFSQVKTSSLVENNANLLFNKFSLSSILRRCEICKEKGHPIEHLLYIMLIIMLQGSRSLLSGVTNLQAKKLKSPINSMLNNENFNWRNLLYRVASKFSKLCPTPEGKISALIIDDTSRVKTGRFVENISWFVDHSKKIYYTGYQTIMAVWHNGVVSVPIDFEHKIGKKKAKDAKKGNYHKGTHTEQRQRMSKDKKTKIVLSMIRRALQRRFNFRYLLWDSWYNNSSSMSFVYGKLKSKGIDLISMLKNNNQKYLYKEQCLNLKEAYRKAGKWQRDAISGILYKSIMVSVLDAGSAKRYKSQTVLGEARICFFKYPKQRKYNAIISTDTELTELEVLSIYLRRWSIEVVFKDLKQHFGYTQSQSSKYAPQIADLTIRCVFYVMFCSMKYDYPLKSTEQLLIEFYTEMEESWLDILCSIVFIQNTERFLKYAVSKGYNDVSALLKDYESIIQQFMNDRWYEDKIEDADTFDFRLKGYRKAS